MDKHPQFFTDKKIPKVIIPFYKNKTYISTVVALSVIVSSIFILIEVFKERPPENVVRYINYYRGKVEVTLDPNTVTKTPKYKLVKHSDNQYSLDINRSEIGYTSEKTYSFGNIKKILRERLTKNRSSINITFEELNEPPEVIFVENPPKFMIKYDSDLESKKLVLIDPVGDGINTGGFSRFVGSDSDYSYGIAKALKESFDNDKDIDIVLTKEINSESSFNSRYDVENFYKPDIIISININNMYEKTVDHTDIHYYSYGSNRAANVNLAFTLRNDLIKSLNISKDYVKARGFMPMQQESAPLGSILIDAKNSSPHKTDLLFSKEEYIFRIASALNSAITTIFNNEK